jgi:putative hydrolase of the HAD superfamily
VNLMPVAQRVRGDYSGGMVPSFGSLAEGRTACARSAGRVPGRAIFFDLYGTLIDIRTDEDDPAVYATLAQYLAYFQVRMAPGELQQQYRSRVRAALAQSVERYPEADVYEIFRDLTSGAPGLGSLSNARVADPDGLALSTAVLYRALTRRSFGVFPDVHQTLERLQAKYWLGLISDAQWVFTDPELAMTDLARFFPVRVLSSHVGVKKPDARIFAEAMRAVGVTPEDSVYVGDNPERDLAGARNAGMKCVLFGAGGGEYGGLRADACFQSYTDLEATLDILFR